ncbi:uroporphyrinogen-III synthase [soil metagenome]
MRNKNIHILSTRPVNVALINEAATKGIQVNTISFIDTVAIDTAEVKKTIDEVAAQPSTIIFTSMNAVDAVVHQLNNKPSWKIFCMGNTTRQLVEKYFGNDNILATGSNATELAKEIIKWEKIQLDKMPVVFFCGDQRRDELPGKLLEQGIEMEEIITYNTIQTTHAITDAYNGILFFSPSAVHSFFKTNKAATETVFFAIGETTANTISSYTNNKIVISYTPAKDELLRQAVDWFNAVES